MKKLSKYLVLFVVAVCATSCNSCESENSGYNVSFQGRKVSKSCYICNGDGKCNQCGGDGMIYSATTYVCRCPRCSGTGFCQDCGGDGIMNN